MKQPAEADFDVRITDVGVDVFFRPTMSYFHYVFLTDPRDIARWGRLSDVEARQDRGYWRLSMDRRRGLGLSPRFRGRRWPLS